MGEPNRFQIDPTIVERLVREGPVPVYLLATHLSASRDRPVRASTLSRYIQRGKLGVHLEGYHDGSMWFTSRQAYARFLASLTGQQVPAAIDTASAAAAARRVREDLRPGKRKPKCSI